MTRWEEIRATRTSTERLMEELLRKHYPDLEFETNQQIEGYLPDFYFPKYQGIARDRRQHPRPARGPG